MLKLSRLDKNQNLINIGVKNLQGVTIYNSTNNSEEQLLNISSAAAGIYFVELVTEREVFTVKVLKQ
jgi:hypothetical protein